MIEYYKKVVFQNYANFSGRARRSEYWYFTLFNFLTGVLLGVLMILLIVFDKDDSPGVIGAFLYFVYMIYSLAIVIPTLAVAVRRLHDIGKSGWNLLWGFLPLVGSILLLVWYCTDSESGENRWGANPKENLRENDSFIARY